jgi:hypothetical protein
LTGSGRFVVFTFIYKELGRLHEGTQGHEGGGRGARVPCIIFHLT